MPDFDLKTLVEILIVVVALFGFLCSRTLSRNANTLSRIQSEYFLPRSV